MIESELDQLSELYAQRDLSTLEKQRLINAILTDEIKAKIQTISANIAARREFRWTDCEVRFNEPRTGKKTVVRMDTGATVEVTNMTPDEMQLKINLPETVDKETGEIVNPGEAVVRAQSSGLNELLPSEINETDTNEDEFGSEETDDFDFDFESITP